MIVIPENRGDRTRVNMDEDRLLAEIVAELNLYSTFDTEDNDTFKEYLLKVKDAIPAPVSSVAESEARIDDMLDFNPEWVRLVFCDGSNNRRWAAHRRHWSRLNYRQAPGRMLNVLVLYGEEEKDAEVLGVIGLTSPVLAMSARDEALKIPSGKGRRGKALRNVADMSTCVGVQPWASRHHGGKLLAMLVASKEVADEFSRRYGKGPDRDCLLWVVTTSVYGKGAQYDKVLKFVGHTKGWGDIHIPRSAYTKMVTWMEARKKTHDHAKECGGSEKKCKFRFPGNRFGPIRCERYPECPWRPESTKEVTSDLRCPVCHSAVVEKAWGDGAGSTRRRIRAFFKATGLYHTYDFKHGKKRGIYVQGVVGCLDCRGAGSLPATIDAGGKIHKPAYPCKNCGGTGHVDPRTKTELAAEWWERWGRPRIKRITGEESSAISS